LKSFRRNISKACDDREDARNLVERATLAGAVLGSGKCLFYGESQMKKRYQIDKQRAVQEFRRLAAQDDQPIQLVIPLKEVLELVQRGLMNLALRMFTEVAEGMMDREVTALVGPKNQSDPNRERVRWSEATVW
jgi:hypothetical protein